MRLKTYICCSKYSWVPSCFTWKYVKEHRRPPVYIYKGIDLNSSSLAQQPRSTSGLPPSVPENSLNFKHAQISLCRRRHCKGMQHVSCPLSCALSGKEFVNYQLGSSPHISFTNIISQQIIFRADVIILVLGWCTVAWCQAIVQTKKKAPAL